MFKVMSEKYPEEISEETSEKILNAKIKLTALNNTSATLWANLEISSPLYVKA